MSDITKRLKKEYGLDFDIDKFLNEQGNTKYNTRAPELLYPLLIKKAIEQNYKKINEGKKF